MYSVILYILMIYEYTMLICRNMKKWKQWRRKLEERDTNENEDMLMYCVMIQWIWYIINMKKKVVVTEEKWPFSLMKKRKRIMMKKCNVMIYSILIMMVWNDWLEMIMCIDKEANIEEIFCWSQWWKPDHSIRREAYYYYWYIGT